MWRIGKMEDIGWEKRPSSLMHNLGKMVKHEEWRTAKSHKWKP